MIKFATFLAAIALAASAQAEAPINVDAPRTAVVRLNDLNLASFRGRSMLKVRIAGAIEEVCGSYANVTEASEADSIGACRAAARQSADRQLAALSTTLELAAVDHRR